MTVEQRYHCSELRNEAGAPFVQSRRRREVRRAPQHPHAINRRVDFEAFDESYLQRLTSGDNTTEQHFVSYFGRLIRMKLRSRVRSQELIDDICQETFLRVLSKLRNKGGVGTSRTIRSIREYRVRLRDAGAVPRPNANRSVSIRRF